MSFVLGSIENICRMSLVFGLMEKYLLNVWSSDGRKSIVEYLAALVLSSDDQIFIEHLWLKEKHSVDVLCSLVNEKIFVEHVIFVEHLIYSY